MIWPEVYMTSNRLTTSLPNQAIEGGQYIFGQ
jgi:hypothetical protein